MAKQEFSIPALMAQVPTEADAHLLLERLRWEDGGACPHCGSVAEHYFLKSANGSRAPPARGLGHSAGCGSAATAASSSPC